VRSAELIPHSILISAAHNPAIMYKRKNHTTPEIRMSFALKNNGEFLIGIGFVFMLIEKKGYGNGSQSAIHREKVK
jgi:hypothetical protein